MVMPETEAPQRRSHAHRGHRPRLQEDIRSGTVAGLCEAGATEPLMMPETGASQRRSHAHRGHRPQLQEDMRGGTVAGLCQAGATEPLMMLHQRRLKRVLSHALVTDARLQRSPTRSARCDWAGNHSALWRLRAPEHRDLKRVHGGETPGNRAISGPNRRYLGHECPHYFFTPLLLELRQDGNLGR